MNYAALISLRDHWNQAYHNGTALVSDEIYNAVDHRVQQIEQSVAVGAPVTSTLTKIPHSVPMLSLEKANSEKDWQAWLKRITKAHGDDVDFTVEPKIDGIAIRLIYFKGSLCLAVTRGDGKIGEDVTLQAAGINGLPLTIPDPGYVEIRGEAYLPLSEFERFKDEYSNPRNLVSGTIRQLDGVAGDRGIRFLAYSINQMDQPPDSQSQALEWLSSWGFENSSVLATKCKSAGVKEWFNHLEDVRDSIDFDIDGAVIKLDSVNLQNQMGVTRHHPKWAVAWKFAGKATVTTLLDVEFNIGRTGQITYVGILDQVNLDGVNISRASLFSNNFIREHNLYYGDYVRLERAGDVIPKITGVVTELRCTENRKVEIPTECPSCFGPLVEVGAFSYCTNSKCPAKLTEWLQYWASRKCLNIIGMGRVVCEDMVSSGLVTDSPADIYFISQDQLRDAAINSPGKLHSNIQNSLNKGLDTYITALGIPKVGSKVAEELAAKFTNIDEIQNLSVSDLISHGFKPAGSKSLHEWFSTNGEIVSRFKEAGVF